MTLDDVLLEAEEKMEKSAHLCQSRIWHHSDRESFS